MRQKTLLTKMMLLVAIVLMGAGTAWAEDVTYTVESTSSVTVSGTAPTGSSATYASTYGTKCQLTSGNSMTLTLSGYEGKKITGLTLSMRSNSSKGAGSLSVEAGDETIASIDAAKFNTSSWYGSWSTSFVDIDVSLTNDSYEIQDGEKVEITIAATENSLYCQSFKITYADASGSSNLTASDLAITGDPVDLSFDLYNNSTPQVIHYTTSGTGDVTVSANSYVSTVVDATNKTITVTPLAVTSGVKTITVNQAADNTYDAGSTTFTVNITDSTPFTGGDVTFEAGKDGNENVLTVTKNGVTLTIGGGNNPSGAGKFYSTDYRIYSGSTLTISTSQGTITQIVFTEANSSYPVSRLSTTIGTFSDCTWTGNAASVDFSASAQARVSKVIVTVNVGGTIPPSISANNVEIDHDATSGSITYTINNEPTPVGTLTASTTSTWLTLGTVGTTIPFTCDANDETTARTATVTLTYTYNTNETVTKDVTITQAAAPTPAVVYSTIPALFAAATGTETEVQVTFDNWVVSGVSTNGKNVFVTDNSGNGFVIYSNSDQSGTYSAGDILSGTAVTCSLKLYNGFAELLNLNASDLTITAGGTVTAANIDMANLAGVNTGALVSYEGLTCNVNNNKYYLSDGTTTLQVYNALYAFDALEDGKTYNITGVYQQYNSTKEILPRSAADIVEVAAPILPSITVNPTSINAPAAGASGTLAVTYTAIETSDIEWYTDASATTTTSAPSWILAEINHTTLDVDYVIDANDGEARVAYMKVYGLDAGSNLVYSDVIAIYQAKFVVETTFTWDLSIASYEDITDPDIVTWLSTYATMTNSSESGGTAASNYLGGDSNNRTSSRFYNGNTLTITPAQGYAITSVVFNATSTNYANALQGSEWTNATATVDNTTVTVTPTDGTAAVSAAIGGTCGFTAVTVNYNEYIPVTVGESKYTSVYYSNKALVVPEGLTAYTMRNVNTNELTLSETFDAGEVVAKDQAVVLYGEPGSYKMIVSTTNGTKDNSSVLYGYDENHVTEGGSVYYRLTTKNGDPSTIGFWWGADNGGAFIVSAHKAYVAVGTQLNFGAGARLADIFGETTTGIDNVNVNSNLNGVYDLQGRRVAQPTKGIYIMNGKKVVIK